jgi:hypothetical protein
MALILLDEILEDADVIASTLYSDIACCGLGA